MTVETRSVWPDPDLVRGGEPLPADATCDVCVVGAGIAGLTTAYLLAKAGRRVLVLEAQPKFAAGETEYTTAHLSSVIDDRFGRLKSVRGAECAKLAYQAHAAAIDTIEQIARDERIDCDFLRVDGYLVPGADGPSAVEDEEKAVRELGIPFERLDRPPVPTFPAGPWLRFPDQGQFHPLKYLAGVARAFAAAGGRIATDCRVEKVEGGSPCRVALRGGRAVTAAAVVVATNTPIKIG